MLPQQVYLTIAIFRIQNATLSKRNAIYQVKKHNCVIQLRLFRLLRDPTMSNSERIGCAQWSGGWRCFWEAFCLSAAQVLLLSFLFALTSYESQSHFSHLIIAVQPSLFVLRAKIPRRNVYQIRKFNCMHISLLREAFLAHTNDNIKLNRTMTIWRLLTANEMKWN